MSYIQKIDLPASSQSRVIKNYSFDANNKLITINEPFVKVLYMFSEETNELIYNPTRKGYGGQTSNNSILLDYDVTTMENYYSILIVADVESSDRAETMLVDLGDKIDQLNKTLTKIYNPE